MQNERIEETGFPTEEAQLHDEIERARVSEVRGQQFLSLVQSPAYQLIDHFLKTNETSLIESLIRENDPKKILRYQALIEAVRLLPKIFNLVMTDAQEARGILDEYLTITKETVN